MVGMIHPLSLARPEDQERFRVTVFAEGLSFPTSMVELADGSLLIATNTGPAASSSLFTSNQGTLLRLVDSDGDGDADGTPSVLASGLPGLITSVRRIDDLIMVLSSQGGEETITLLRTGADPTAPLSRTGSLHFRFPSGFEHSTNALALRQAATGDGSVEVFFNIGARLNNAATQETVGLRGDGTAVLLDEVQLEADSIHRLTLTPVNNGSYFSASTSLIARGLRNAAGMTFSPQGDLYLQDNGIDGTPRDVSLSADELNRILADEIGRSIPDFGFPNVYVDAITGALVRQENGANTPATSDPLIVFRPIDSERSEGAVELTMAPQGFGVPYAGGVFIGFIGMVGRGGSANMENPIVFANPTTGEYYHFIANQLLGNPYGLTATSSSLFLSDLSRTGSVFSNRSDGVIYQITPLAIPVNTELAIRRDSAIKPEGLSGSTPFRFTVSRSGDLFSASSATWNVTGNKTHRASGADFVGGSRPSGTVVFQPGQSRQTITIHVAGDTAMEADESFVVLLSQPSGATIRTARATGIIRNDDLIGTNEADSLVGSARNEFINGRAGVDSLLGGGGADVFGFGYGESPITAPDHITDFRFGEDLIDLFTNKNVALAAPDAFSRAADNSSATSMAALAAAVFSDADGNQPGRQPLQANAAALVVATQPSIAGTYLLINNGKAGRNNSADLLINISGYAGELPGLGAIAVNSVFA